MVGRDLLQKFFEGANVVQIYIVDELVFVQFQAVIDLIDTEPRNFGDGLDREKDSSVVIGGAVASPKPQVVEALPVLVCAAPRPCYSHHRAKKYALCGG